MTAEFALGPRGLQADEVPLAEVAAAVGTPTYVYSETAVAARYRGYAEALAPLGAMVCYALKANGCLAVVRALARLGAGADVVSEGELRRALAAGVPPGRIVFSGVGKTEAEIAFALETGIHQLNAESLPEIEAIGRVARRLGRKAEIAIRVNPDVDAGTHAKITTGKSENKFGIALSHAREAFAAAAAEEGVEPLGIALHIGSQLTTLAPYRAAYGRVAALVQTLRDDGIPIRRLDLGGGLGIRYRGDETPPDLADYAQVVRETVGHLGCELTVEPGRSLVGEAGVLLARVIYVKEGPSRRFVILDAAMNDLIRPALYEAWHAIEPVAPRTGAEEPADVVGPVCESGDTFAVQRPLPPLLAGDLVVFRSAGAYGAVMSSTYNARPLPAEVLVRGREWAVVRPRPTYAEMMAGEHAPPWQEA